MSPPLKLVLHLQLDASGALTGSVDTPDTPPKHIELTNVHLAGTYAQLFAGSAAARHLSRSAQCRRQQDAGPSHVGQDRRGPAGGRGRPAVALQQIAGDWESPPFAAGAGPPVLRLRLDAGGALTGTIDAPEPMSARVKLSGTCRMTGRTLLASLPDGNRFQGTLSGDGKSLAASPQSTMAASWHHVRTAAQAAAYDADGQREIQADEWHLERHRETTRPAFRGSRRAKGTQQLTFHFAGDPAVCSVAFIGKERTDTVPCQMTLTGNGVQVNALGIGGVHGHPQRRWQSFEWRLHDGRQLALDGSDAD